MGLIGSQGLHKHEPGHLSLCATRKNKSKRKTWSVLRSCCFNWNSIIKLKRLSYSKLTLAQLFSSLRAPLFTEPTATVLGQQPAKKRHSNQVADTIFPQSVLKLKQCCQLHFIQWDIYAILIINTWLLFINFVKIKMLDYKW